MSRHRNVRNLTEDDYYDDYDDYDDYDEEEEAFDDSYYQEPPPPQQASQSQTFDYFSPKKHQPQQSNEEKIRLVQGMGFSKDQATMALSSTSGNVQEAINLLLSGGGLKSDATKKGGISKPPANFGAPPGLSQDTRSGVTKPPVGFGPPPGMGGSKKGGISKPPSGFGPPPGISQSPAKKAGATKPHAGITSTPTKKKKDQPIVGTTPKKDYGPYPKLASDVKKELNSQKSRLSMVVLGHVDAGKSTLMGQVLVKLGHVAKRTVQKYEKQANEIGKASFALAWVMDEDDAERERGVTMDVATKAITTDKHNFVVLDAPGHADFVPSMITGAAAADVGILVIAATTGEFEAGFDGGGQTREHIILARGLGVSQLIVAINKLDVIDWNEARFNEIKAKINPFLLQTGFNAKRIQFVPISGLTGANIKSKEGAANLYQWYKGPTLLHAMDKFQPAVRGVDKPLRVIVNDVYTEGNKGITAMCRVVQGVVQVGDKLAVLPIGDEATVSRIEHGTASSENQYKYAMAGDTAEILLLGIDIARVATGNVLCHPHWDLRPPLKRKVEARVMVMEELTVPIIRGAQVLLHMHSIDVPTVLSKLLSSVNPKRGNLKNDQPRVLTAGVNANVQLTFSEKICVETYSNCRALGRFVLRRGGDTIAVGIIEKVL